MRYPDSPALIWLISLSSAILKITPSTTLLSIGLALTAQVAMLLSFLLPLKVIMLLRTKELPNVLPDIAQGIAFEPFILLLCGLTLTFFLIQFFSNKLAGKLATNNANYILAKCDKLVIFEDQETIAKTAYNRITETSSCILFSLFGVAIFAYLYPDFALVFLLTLAVTVCSLSLLYRYNRSIHQGIDKAFPQAIQTPANLAFLALFAYIVIDFLYLSPPNFLIAIATVILSRQIIAQMQLTARNTNALLRQRDKLSAIFLKDHHHNPAPQLVSHSLWFFLANSERVRWVTDQLATALGVDPDNIKMSWADLEIPNCAAFILEISGARYLAKIFDQNRKSHALHEATILLSQIDELPAPRLLVATKIDRYHCHVFGIDGIDGINVTENNTSKRNGNAFRKKLLAIEPNKELVEKFLRSRKTLQNRITEHTLRRLEIAVASKDDQEQLERVISSLGYIADVLNDLPLRLAFNSSRSLKFGQTEGGEEILLHWSGWSLEPMGAWWPISQDDINELKECSNQITHKNTELDKLPQKSFVLAALMFNLERDIEKQRLSKGLKTVKIIASTL